MQRLWYYFLRTYVWIGLHFYFRKIIVRGREDIPTGPVLFAANHQNAFLDALLIVCFNSHVTYFLTRADIFKKPFVRWLLGTMNMVPIYRVRDGWDSLDENQKTFETCFQIFQKQGAIVIFPEGNHGAQRRVRPLSKGFTRVAFEAINKDPSLTISVVPVGLNFSHHQAFRSCVSIDFGKPLVANNYLKGTIPASAIDLRNDLATRLKQLTTHVEDATRYEETIHQLEKTNPDYLDPLDTNQRIEQIESGEGLLHYSRKGKTNTALVWLNGLWRLLHFLPLQLWQTIRKRIKDPVFVASLKFGTGIFLFPFFHGLIIVLLTVFFSWEAAGAWLVITIVLTLLMRHD